MYMYRLVLALTKTHRKLNGYATMLRNLHSYGMVSSIIMTNELKKNIMTFDSYITLTTIV